MGDLELEPVSDGDSSFGDMDVASDTAKDIEDEDEKMSEPELNKTPSNVREEDIDYKPKEEEKEEGETSDEGEIKSDAEPELTEEEKERLAKRKPIEFVNFGEAEKRARQAQGGSRQSSQDSRYYSSDSYRRSGRSEYSSSYSSRSGYGAWQQGE